MDTPPHPSQGLHLTPRQRVEMSLHHQTPDRTPADFLATPEVWHKLIRHFAIEAGEPAPDDLYENAREAVLRKLEIDCRVVSYDMFLTPPAECLPQGGAVDWWSSKDRSTPNRMWRYILADGTYQDIWGRHSGTVTNEFGSYDEIISSPLAGAASIAELQSFAWPEPDWWDFTPLPGMIATLDRHTEYHIRYRAGSIFEVAWQLRGMEAFLLDMATQPELAEYILDRLTEISVENLGRVLELAGDRIDAVYFYDDVATQNSLMFSKKMWQRFIQPRHARIVDLARKYGKHVMYHCDGAVSILLPDLIDMGIDIINPVQPDAKGMDPEGLKARFGGQLAFHGGIDIIKTLRTGTPQEVAAEVQARRRTLGPDGGYILTSSHHIQPDTPIENILALYDPTLR